jgi:hypothetical protein
MGSRLRRAASCVVLTVVTGSVPGIALPTASAAVAPQVTWSDDDVVAGDTVRAKVSKASHAKGTRLVLQREHLDRWRTADRSAKETKRGYVLEVPTDQLGRFRFRVVARKDGEVVARSAEERITVRPPYDPVGRRKQHAFSAQPRVRWDPCRQITWTFNRAHAPDHALRQLRAGMRRIHLATGLDFEYVGRTDRKPNPFGNNVDDADVIVGWRTAKDFRPFNKNPYTVGLGGNKYYTGYQEADGSRVSKAFQGGIVLNASMRDRMSNGYGKGSTWGEVIIHELGHVVGLTHAGAKSQIMYYSVIRRDADWGAGDLAGFRRLGDVRGCLERAPARTPTWLGRSRLHGMELPD